MKTMRLGLAVIILLSVSSAIHGQGPTKKDQYWVERDGYRPLIVGENVPADFWNRKHLFFIDGDTVRKDLSAYEGKVLVLDFWYIGCSTCLAHQRDIHAFKEAYPEAVEVLMVNNLPKWDSIERIQAFYGSKRYEQFGMNGLTSVIYDDYLYDLFAANGYPLYVWIRPKGSIAVMTNENLFDPERVIPMVKRK